MPEFKVVVSDPEAGEPKPILVKVVSSNDLAYEEQHKTGKVLPICRVNPKTAELIKSPYGICTLRIWKNKATKEKVNLTVKLVTDPSIPEDVAVVPANFLSEKIGAETVLGELFRANSFQITLTDDKARVFLGKKIGDFVEASIVGLPAGKKLLITGGSDNTGFPMLPTLQGGVKKALLLEEPPGFHPQDKGERRRKYVRGNTITEEIVQINTKLVS
ncbi:MAG: 30S ribosomal protein S6e [Zestosphaera tikiterensis]|uniref:Small ribosomal subunit protein eS6 n=1 Tax=Zestosphaera tikiterensis TaxID=1973259 RepID=A0A2R7Y7F7_9CREN|nr:MAG: 30S ribosomal protein S6e [Zestosphaera tikiterensis]